jgi:hypothetical protein
MDQIRIPLIVLKLDHIIDAGDSLRMQEAIAVSHQVISVGDVFLDGSPMAFISRRRFVGFLDVLGMRRWLLKEDAESGGAGRVAQHIYSALSQSLTEAGTARFDHELLGPFVGWAMFSDSIFVYS